MRNTRQEDLSEHSFDVAVISHALAVIGNKRLGKNYDAQRCALLGLYHDAPEIITGDMPTPVKYYSDEIRDAYKQVEKNASARILSMLPDYMIPEYDSLFNKKDEDKELWVLVKAADKLSALIKCIEEEKAGNNEFQLAKASSEETLDLMNCEEAEIFIRDFLPGYSLTLDQMNRN